MSITVEYFFNSDLKFVNLTQAFIDTLGLPFAAYEGNPTDQFCRQLGIELTLSTDHGFENDRDCNFSDFRYVIWSRTPIPDADLRPMQIEFVALLAYAMHRRLHVHGGMLTFDLQSVLARYAVAQDRWIDELSSQPVLFPEHLRDLRGRVRRDGWGRSVQNVG